MISTIAVHQPPSLPPNATGTSPRPTSSRHRLSAASPSPSSGPQFRRLLPNLQFLDLTDCVSLEDSGVKMVVETCPQLLYLFMRRCSNITGGFCTQNCQKKCSLGRRKGPPKFSP